VRKIAQGAALMTETTFDEIFCSGCSSLINNAILADLQNDILQEIGPIHFTAEENRYAQTINDHFSREVAQAIWTSQGLDKSLWGKPLYGENFSSLDAGRIDTGSTDVGDVSWITPLSMLNTACWASGTPSHSWGTVATGAMSIGHKGMLHAAKTMAVAAVVVMQSPDLLEKVRAEFTSQTSGQPYHSPLPDGVKIPGQ